MSLHIASEYDFDGDRNPWRTLVVAITQNGEIVGTLSAFVRPPELARRILQ